MLHKLKVINIALNTTTKKPLDFHLKAFKTIFPMPFPWMGLNVVSKAPISNSFIEDLQLLIDLTG
jgi:hypothetical protein